MTQTQGAGSTRRPPRLIVGLGNPGAEYAKTRHNAGFWFCARLARELGVSLTKEARFRGEVAQMRANFSQSRAGNAWLLLPQTFMNHSGQAVQALMNFYQLEPDEMLVVHDELDLQPGTLRLKFGGGLGGHNGLKDITAHLGTQDYWRLRIGIGHPGERDEVINYVLKPPRQEEGQALDAALARALASWPWLARGDWAAAMQKLNSMPKPDEPVTPVSPSPLPPAGSAPLASLSPKGERGAS